jgi:predicted membrane-bound mannosyltransferase
VSWWRPAEPARRRFVRVAGLVLAGGVALAAIAIRLVDFGRYGFWNDEAWVALSTRVEGISQFWLSLSTTPIRARE